MFAQVHRALKISCAGLGVSWSSMLRASAALGAASRQVALALLAMTLVAIAQPAFALSSVCTAFNSNNVDPSSTLSTFTGMYNLSGSSGDIVTTNYQSTMSYSIGERIDVTYKVLSGHGLISLFVGDAAGGATYVTGPGEHTAGSTTYSLSHTVDATDVALLHAGSNARGFFQLDADYASTIVTSQFQVLSATCSGPAVTPAVTSLSPASGPTAGGTSVVLAGTDFTGATAVKFGATNATSFTVDSATQITAVSPAGSAGSVNVTVTNSAGTSTTGAGNAFAYVAAPTVTTIAPASGPTTGGTSVVLTGTNLTGATGVSFGATSASGFTVNSATQITATAPAGSGSVNVRVTTAGGTSATGAGNVYAYTAAPTVTSASPSSGPTSGGGSVVLTGTNLTGATAVKFGATNATSFTVDSATQITAVSPAGAAGAVTIDVTTPGGTGTLAAGYAYVVAPTISNASPNSGPTAGGTSVVITGSNFIGVTGVKFGGVDATGFTVNSATQITATTPAGAAGAVAVAVIAAGGTATQSSAFTYVAAPTVISLAPSSGPAAGGTSVVLAGANLTGATAVKFGATNATSFTVDSATQITAVSPAGSGATNVTVTTTGGTSGTGAGNVFTFISAPTVSAANPAVGATAGGTSVVLTGTNLTGVTTVTFGGTNATSFTVDSASQITAVSPAGSVGSVDIAVTSVGGAATQVGAFTYVAGPTVSAVSPSSGPAAGGTSVVLTGANLTGATAVNFGAAAATGFTVDSATQITATAPAGSGTVNVRVTTVGGTSATGAGNAYVYVAAPTVTAATPSAGPTAGGTSVVLTGTSLTGATAVKFGGVDATGFTVNSATQITATASAGAAGSVAIDVTTPGGTGTLAAGYTYVAAPTLSSVSPNTGSDAGGATVTLTGTDFAGVVSVKFGGVDATSFTVNSATQITATTPAGSAGAVAVAVTAAGGTISQAGAYTYVVAPAVSSLSPSTGATAGGTSVVLTGANLTGATVVKFGATNATSFTLDSATQITAVSPPGAAGSVNVTVTTPGGTSAGGAGNLYAYVAAPTVTAAAPSAGSTLGATSVVLTGTNFTSVTAVKFGGVDAAAFTVNSATQITATTAAGAAGAADVSVTATGGTGTLTSGYTYVAPPTLSGVSPSSGPDAGGASVVLTGTNFTGVTAVKFGATNATSFTVDSATQITAVSPAGAAGTVAMSVTAAGGTGSQASAYTYIQSPAVLAVSPSSGPLAGGTTVILTGANLTGATAVKFGATDATSFTVDSATQITAVSPAGAAGSVNVIATTPGGTSLAGPGNVFTYLAAPTITAANPSAGPVSGGTSVVLTGTNLTGATAVKFGGVDATSFTVNSATQITATTPAGAAGIVAIDVTTPGGTGTLAAGYTYAAAPTLTNLAASSGPAAGGATVVLTGTNLTGATAVKFGATNATSFAVDSATQITAVSPAGAAGSVNVTVTSPGGTSAAGASSAYLYVAAPTVTSLSPTFGPAAGGTTVVLAGANLTGATAVQFGATNATSFTVDSATQITAVSPAGANGVVNVTVVTAGGTSAAGGGNAFTYGDGPSVTSLSPANGVLAGGGSVVLTGANFTGATAVKFGATNATSFTVDSATQITATAPAGAAGSVNVGVTTPVGASASGAGNLYTYVPAPALSGLTPNTGYTTGGTSVVIGGSNLTGATAVSFGTLPATSFTVDSATQITAVSPAAPAGPVNVTVTTPGGTSGTSVFTYASPPPPAPSLTISSATPDGTVGQAYVGGFTAANGQAPYSFSLTSGDLPAGLSLSPSGALTGTPTAEGQFPVTVTVMDASQATAAAHVTLNIKKAQLTLPDAPLSLTMGIDLSLSFAPSGGISPYRFSVSGQLPPGLNFNSTTGVLSGAPTIAGAYNFSVTVTDSSPGTPLTVTRSYAFSVVAATPPVADPVNLALTPSSPTISIDLRDKVHGDYTQIIIVRQPQFGTASIRVSDASSTVARTTSNGAQSIGLEAPKSVSLIYTRNSGYSGPDAFLYAAVGPGGQSPSARVVIGSLPAPTANPDAALVGSGKSTVIAVTANDAGEFDSIAIDATASHGTASVSGLSVTYAAPSGFSGTDSFTYTLTGPGGVSLPAKVTVTVQPPAVAGPGVTVAVLAGQPATVELTTGATGGPFTGAAVVSINPAESGTAVIQSPASGRYALTYTSGPGFSGTAVVQYTISNATSVSSPSTVTVIVTPRPDPSLDAQVRGLIAAQDATARRFANTQILNYGRRLEQLHNGGGSGADSMLSLQGGVSGEDRFEARDRALRTGAFDIAYAGDDVGRLARVGVLASKADAAGVRDTPDRGRGLEAQEPTRWGVWAAGSADLGLREAFTGQRGFRFTTDGLTIGADYRLNSGLAIGAGLGYGRDSTRIGNEGTKSRADAFSGALYASAQPTEHAFIDGVLGYGALSFDSRRFVTATGSMVTGKRDGDQLFASLTGGGQYQNGGLMLSPYGRLAMTRSTLSSGTEIGDPLWALTYQSQEVSSLTATLGLRADFHRKVSIGELSPRMRFEYSHDFEGAADAGVSYADWQGGPVYRMVVEGLDRDVARIELGVDLRLDNGMRFGLDLDNLLGATSQSHGVRLSIQAPLR
ncbi:MAG: IPT/TIG domain-containing protein [Phenylobacterium sp.]|uniref:IPT/TIG domain-containing protein n=1 Tax=Phenylobacterium sp. TaxID=1871053 RepID=UPI003BB60888